MTKPSTTSRMLPCAAPATASTLSRPITASAITMVRIAVQKPAAGATSCWPPASSLVSRRYAIQTRSAPPAAIRPGTCSSHRTATVRLARTTTAPTVPQATARRCRSLGRLRAASAMTIALSPASTRSMTTIAASAERKSMRRFSRRHSALKIDDSGWNALRFAMDAGMRPAIIQPLPARGVASTGLVVNPGGSRTPPRPSRQRAKRRKRDLGYRPGAEMSRTKLRRYFRHGLLPQLFVFEAVARLGSVTRAAAELHLAQPTVSLQLKKLAETLEVTLFEQHGRMLRLTAGGHALREACEEMLLCISNLDKKMAPSRGVPVETLRLAAEPEARELAARLVAAFCAFELARSAAS